MTSTLVLFAVGAVLMTFVGGAVPLGDFLSRRALARLFSVRAGILLAVAFTEVLPEAWRASPAVSGWAAVGAFGVLFFMSTVAMVDTCPEYLADCRVHLLSWTAVVALSLHSLIDGFNLGVAFSAGRRAGVAVGLALALHKVADGFTLTSLFRQSGYTRRGSMAGTALVAAATPVGAALARWTSFNMPIKVEAGLLGFAAGSFIYIAAADIFPRLHRDEDKGGLIYLACGVAGMAALKFL